MNLPRYRVRQIVAIVAAVLCAVGLGLAAHFQTATNAENTAQLQQTAKRLSAASSLLARQEAELIQSCERQNVSRIEQNISNLADYRVFKVVLLEFIHQPVPPGSSPAQVAYRHQFLVQLQRAVMAKTWTPRTDCDKAVRLFGPSFKAPAPIPFVKQMPERGSLTLYPSDFGGTPTAKRGAK